MTQNFILSAVLCELLAALAWAAPIADEAISTTFVPTWGYGTGGGIIGFIILVLDIIVFIEVLRSNRPPASKLLWCLIVFFFPLLGMLIYYLFSNREAHNGHDYTPLP